MRKRLMKRKDLDDYLDDDIFDMNLKDDEEYKEPDTWTIVTAMNRVLDQARDSELSDEFWEVCKNPLEFLTKQLGLSKIQVVVLAILIESGEPMSWRKIGNFLGCSRLSVMVHSEDIEEMVDKRWFERRSSREAGGRYEGFALVHGVVTAIRHNRAFVPENLEGLNEQQLIDKLESHIHKGMGDSSQIFEDEEKWMVQLCAANPHLPLCHAVLQYDDIHVQSLLLMAIFDYTQYADSDDEGLERHIIDSLYPDDSECDGLRRKLRNGTHILICDGYIDQKCENGIANTNCYILSRKTKDELLSAYRPSRSQVPNMPSKNRFLKSFTTIKEKNMFYNSSDQKQIERLISLLKQDSLPAIQKRLEDKGLRKGFACLFYGAPGTGKTETVLQLARQTGRDIMQVDIAGMRDKYVGESEKNIKAVFSNYRTLCENAEVMPILFFNEADGIFGKRTENIEHSVEKMDNAMQNIILQEIENLDGILIATTNLTCNLDNAFERRFLFKVEFHKPETNVKAQIWSAMLKGNISQEDAMLLASKFDLSGGQIENVVRKSTIDFILSGKETDITALEVYCQDELLNTKGGRKSIAGFMV